MATNHSLKRRLLICVAVALTAFFGVGVFVLDALFQRLADRSLGELLDAQMLALIGAAAPDNAGGIASTAASYEVRLQTPGSGLYAEIRERDGKAIWRSPSMAGTFFDFTSGLQPGERHLDFVKTPRGERLAVASRGISWDLAGRAPQQLVFTVASSLMPYDAQLQRFRQQLIGGFGVLGLLLVLTLSLLLRWVMSPLERLETEIGEVESAQRTALASDYPRELQGVARNLNALLDSERRRITRYRDTLGNLAHSLKTPLAVIRATLGGREAQAPVIEQEVQRMTAIIEHQLKRAVTSGGTAVAAQSVPLLALLHDLKPALRKVHANKDLLMQCDVAENIDFLGDRDDLTEVLGNLLDNACKWCRGQLCISASVDPDALPARRLLIAFDDDGPGIAASKVELVLRRGQRADETTPGHGLGLAMVSDTVELYGGSIEIKPSVSLGGARIELLLPGRARSSS